MLGRELLVFNATIQLKTVIEIINWDEKGHEILSLSLKSKKFRKNYHFFFRPRDLSTPAKPHRTCQQLALSWFDARCREPKIGKFTFVTNKIWYSSSCAIDGKDLQDIVVYI